MEDEFDSLYDQQKEFNKLQINKEFNNLNNYKTINPYNLYTKPSSTNNSNLYLLSIVGILILLLWLINRGD